MATIAVVDDYKPFREELCRTLEKKGFRVLIQAEHGADLLSQLKTLQTLPDLCLCDINMPVMNGFETARQLKEKYPAIRLMGFSTDDGNFNRREMLECGADDFMSKNSMPDEYAKRLILLLNIS